MESKKKTLQRTIMKIKLFLLSHIISHIQKNDQLIKTVEYTRGLYRYPKMLGRHCPIYSKNQKTDVLVFAAHPDDDVLGLGTTLLRHSLNGESIKIVFITNGTGRDSESWYIKADQAKKKFDIRYFEAIQALSIINIPKENIFSLGFPDGGTQRYLKHISKDVHTFLQELNPGRVYVHCIEGGHGDHDLTSYVVKSVCHKIGYQNVFEWTEYNPIQPIGTSDVRFLSTDNTSSEEISIDISEEERSLKRKMLKCHQSQDVEQYYMMGEAIRQADTSQMDNELKEYCQISKKRLQPFIKNFKNNNGYSKKITALSFLIGLKGNLFIGLEFLIDTLSI
ncbi:PIG-L deacetylase family protein [Neobacillus muris]|uniref:PIG-L deacetylase family protein n=1 Tax=Neobacillus muris TaxID=2941334 RepID=UPI00203FEC16|nr:PIG-L family deacetylase [Neobacillus muris]